MLLREIPARQPSASRGLATSQRRELAALTRDVKARAAAAAAAQDARPVMLGYFLALLATRAFGVLLRFLIDYWNQISTGSLPNTPL